ncbi:MAG: TetR/AcrR family transcriptional regulator [Gammaproteobacteria bacterium]|nr:TetR/AcrR family transcriptional regulator [Gammaproteobacteria bacterium]
MKTRERIIELAQKRFNELGYGNVTTAALAAELGISEGNLWYHFKTKRDLLEAISEQFFVSINERFTLRPSKSRDVIDDYIALMAAHEWELLHYRFLYRDQSDYGQHSSVIGEHIAELYEKGNLQFKAFFGEMMRVGVLDWPRARIDSLAINVTILIRFGLEYQRESQQAFDSSAVSRTFLQHLTLFEHQLEPSAARRLRKAAKLGISD